MGGLGLDFICTLPADKWQQCDLSGDCCEQSVCYRRDVGVAKKTAKRVKHVPQRTCVGCRQTLAKRSMIRIVRTPEGLRVDPTGKIPGRGAYLHDHRDCWESGLKGTLAHALNVDLTDMDRDTLRAFMATLPEQDAPSGEGSLSQEGSPEAKQGARVRREENEPGKAL